MLKSILISFVLLIPVFAFAETFELKNGKIIEGQVVEETEDWIKLDLGIGVPITYFKEEIKNYKGTSTNKGDAALPSVFTMDELTPEQRKNLKENYITDSTAQFDVSSGQPLRIRSANAQELVSAAGKLSKNGLFEEAILKAQEAIDQDPNYLPAYRLKADILQESGSADKSIALYDQILEKNPNDDEVYMNRGYAYGRMNDFKHAIEDYNNALEINPNSVHAISARASAYFNTGEMNLAQKDYEKLIDFDTEQAKYGYYGLGNIAAYNGNSDEALSYYDKAITAAADFAPAYLMKGQIVLQKGNKEEAKEAFDKAESLGLIIPQEIKELLQ